jgi:hypothetical protein
VNELSNPAQSQWPVVVNENFDALPNQVYAYDYLTSTGLTWGYFGGRWGGFSVAAGTLSLTNASDNHIVVLRSSGAISTSTSNTNWNNTTSYARVYKVTTAGSVVTAVEDHRSGTNGAHGGSASSGASTTQTGEMMAGYIGTVADKDYRIVVKAAHGGTITETTTRSESGTATFTFKVNTTALGGTANSVSSSEQSQAHASSNTFAADDDIVITASSNSACLGASFTIKYTRTLS